MDTCSLIIVAVILAGECFYRFLLVSQFVSLSFVQITQEKLFYYFLLAKSECVYQNYV